jgi:hypothetical protein
MLPLPVQRSGSNACLAEMREFAGFPAASQRYVRRSLDVGLERGDVLARWARHPAEESDIRAQTRAYRLLDGIRAAIPDGLDLHEVGPLMEALLTVTAFDLCQGKLDGFSAYRFLYERLLGPDIRPWLPSAFCAAAALPLLHPELRKALLQSLPESAATACGWSARKPQFFPDWVDKVPAIVAQ